MASKANKRTAAARAAPVRMPGPPTGGTNWAAVWVVLAGFAAAAAVFSPALDGAFVFDDHHLPFADPDAALMPASFWIGGVRPLLMASYWVNFQISGTQVFSYHVVNVGLHAVSATLLFFILQRLLSISDFRRTAFWPALAGSLLFLLHPLQTESVDYIAGRSELLSGLFVLAGWLLFLRGFEAAIGPLRATGILLCALSAVLAKESGVCLVLLLLATDFYWRPGGIDSLFRKRGFLYVPLLAGGAFAGFAILRRLERSGTAGFSGLATPWQYALTETRAIAIYMRLFFFPVGQNVDWQLPIYHSAREAWPYLLFLAALGAAIWWSYQRIRLASFGLLVFLLALSPTSSFVPINDSLAERRMYLPIAGLIASLIGITGNIRLDRRIQGAIAILALTLCGAASYARSRLWSSDLLLWQDVIDNNPRNARAYAGLGGAFMSRRECVDAAREYRKVVDLEGMNEISGRNLATAYECSAQNDKALATYRALIAVHQIPEAWNRIGYLEALKDHVDVSLAAFENALRLDPNNAVAYSYRGTGRLALGDSAGARADFRRALALDPANAVAAAGLAKLPAEK
jgi:protein O-mannosyl-transferase